jgi:site-specific recombinase XerD
LSTPVRWRPGNLDNPSDTIRPWDEAAAAFLTTKTEHTRRSYARTLRDFYMRARKAPDSVTAADVAAYRLILEARGNRPGTVANRLAAISSFYRFLQRPADARGRVLVTANPAAGVERPKVSPYHRARKATLVDVRALLAHLDQLGDVRALRDRALLLAYIFTGRRRAEIARLRAGDLVDDNTGRTLYRYTGKAGKTGYREYPPPALEALRAYLAAARRPLEDLDQDAPLFVSLSRTSYGRTLSAYSILRSLKDRARELGIPPDHIRTHGLRHLAAELRRLAGATVEDVRDFLDHSSLGTTGIYLRQVEGVEDKTWRAVEAILGATAKGETHA